MKLPPSALAILLSIPASQAFAPTLYTHHYRAVSLRPLRSSTNQPAPREEEEDELPISLRSTEEQLAKVPDEGEPKRKLDPRLEEYIYDMYDKEPLLKSMGVNSLEELDAYSPDVYVKPRPGKYGWKPIELTREYKHAMDAKTEQVMSDNEREENLKIHVQLYEDSVRLNKLGDRESGREARIESDKRAESDPWFDLNERMYEAVKVSDSEEVTYLKGMIEKIKGPPPSLKDKVNEDGYVPPSSMYSLTLSNERLEELIKDYDNDQISELQRQDSIVRSLENIEWDKYDTREDDEIWVKEMADERYWDRIRWLGETATKNEDYLEYRKEVLDEERKELMQKWKRMGVEETPEDFYSDWEARKEKLDTKLSTFAKEARRRDSLYEDEEDMEFDEYGYPVYSEEYLEATRPKTHTKKYLEAARKAEANGRPRVEGDKDVFRAELDPDMEINEGSIATTGPLTVEVNSVYNAEQSDPPARKHCFQYTVRITNNSETDTVQLLSRRFYIQTLASEMKDVVQGEGVTGRQPVLKPGEVFEYTSTAPLSTRPLGTTIIAARMSGEYRYCTLKDGQETATEEQINKGEGEAGAELAMFHFVFPEDQRVTKWWSDDDDLDDDDDDDDFELPPELAGFKPKVLKSPSQRAKEDDKKKTATVASVIPSTPPNSLPGDPDITSGNISGVPNDSSDTVSSDVRVVVTSKYLPERSDAPSSKYCFAYNVRISNESKNQVIQLVSRRFEIQNIGSQTKDIVQGANVTGRQPVLKPGENFEYTSTAPLSVTPMLDKTRVLSRMSGEYNCVLLADDGVTPLSSTPLKAELGTMHFILPDDQ